MNLFLMGHMFSFLSQQPHLCCLRREPVRKCAESRKRKNFSVWNKDNLQIYLGSLSFHHSLPFIPFFPFIGMLFQCDVNALDLLCNLSYIPSSGV